MELFFKDNNGEFHPYMETTVFVPSPTSDDLSSENSISNKELSGMTMSEVSEICQKQRKTIALCLGCPIHAFCDRYLGRQGGSASPKYWPLDE